MCVTTPADDADEVEQSARRRTRILWIALAVVIAGSFAVLGGMVFRIDDEKPPIPERVVTSVGDLITDRAEIQRGQAVWQAIGGHQIGSIWGHGAYVAPDWTADWLHREATFVLDRWAADEGAASVDALGTEPRAALEARLVEVMRTNTYDADTGDVTLDPVRADAYEANVAHLSDVFREGDDAYAIPAGAITDPDRREALGAFVFWTSWAASTERPGSDVTYTQNWPHEPLVENTPPADNIFWSIISIILLLGGIAGMVWYFASRPEAEPIRPRCPTATRCSAIRRRRRSGRRSSTSSWSARCWSCRSSSACSLPTTGSKAAASTASRSTRSCPIRWCGPGTPSSVCSGSPRRSPPPASTWPPGSVGASPATSDSV